MRPNWVCYHEISLSVGIISKGKSLAAGSNSTGQSLDMGPVLPRVSDEFVFPTKLVPNELRQFVAQSVEFVTKFLETRNTFQALVSLDAVFFKNSSVHYLYQSVIRSGPPGMIHAKND